jgi:hypothetical protein
MSTLNITTTIMEPGAMFLRQGLVDGTTPDGTEIELSLSGASLVMTVGKFEGNDSPNRTVETLQLTELARVWAQTILEGRDT